MAISLQRLKGLVRRFGAAESGATAIEYSIMAAGIAGVVVLTVYALGSSLNTNVYGKVIANWK